jgi:hypothetical protein
MTNFVADRALGHAPPIGRNMSDIYYYDRYDFAIDAVEGWEKLPVLVS